MTNVLSSELSVSHVSVKEKWQMVTQSLLSVVEALLLAHPEGISEYNLLKCLQTSSGESEAASTAKFEQWNAENAYERSNGTSSEHLSVQPSSDNAALFSSLTLSEPLALFRTHFVLFNGLYQLRQTWREQGIGDIDIYTLNIRPIPLNIRPLPLDIRPLPLNAQGNNNSLSTADPLAEYYLDWDNLTETSQAEVETLLDSFWLNYLQQEHRCAQKKNGNTRQLEKSYAVLALPINAPLKAVKRQYLKLIHQHHPDKGGDVHSAQMLQGAYTYILESQGIR